MNKAVRTQTKRRYLGYVECSKCGEKGSLMGTFMRQKGERTWYFKGFEVFHRKLVYSPQKWRKTTGTKKQRKNKSFHISKTKRMCYLGRTFFSKYKIGMLSIFRLFYR